MAKVSKEMIDQVLKVKSIAYVLSYSVEHYEGDVHLLWLNIHGAIEVLKQEVEKIPHGFSHYSQIWDNACKLCEHRVDNCGELREAEKMVKSIDVTLYSWLMQQ